MTPIAKALWFIESRFLQEISLTDVAQAAGVSRYHLTRAFGYATGSSVMRYVRGRRLTEAARALAEGAPDILGVALESGYGSHEAFTRAFRDFFGVTPESVRDSRSLSGLELMEPIKMDKTLLAEIAPPRFEDGRVLLIAGIGQRYTADNSSGIPAQWQKFVPHIGHVPGQVGSTAYGVLCNGDDTGSTEYICGVEVSDFNRSLPPDWSRIRIPEQRYAVFTHREHISAIRRTWFSIWNKWLPDSGYTIVPGGPEFERYTEEFDPIAGIGGTEIWIPVREASMLS